MTINAKVTKGSFNGQPVVLVTESDGSSFTVAGSDRLICSEQSWRRAERW